MGNEVPKNGSIIKTADSINFPSEVQVVHQKIKTASRIDKLSAVYRKIDGQQT